VVHLKTLFQAIVVTSIALASATAANARSEQTSATEATPASIWDCATACNDCESDCGRVPAGGARVGCVHACESSAARCCSGYGKKPPGSDCYCQ
jgi:hypothetical protein